MQDPQVGHVAYDGAPGANSKMDIFQQNRNVGFQQLELKWIYADRNEISKTGDWVDICGYTIWQSQINQNHPKSTFSSRELQWRILKCQAQVVEKIWKTWKPLHQIGHVCQHTHRFFPHVEESSTLPFYRCYMEVSWNRGTSKSSIDGIFIDFLL